MNQQMNTSLVSEMTQDEKLVKDLITTCNALVENEKRPPKDTVLDGYRIFRNKFSPEKLESLTGEDIIETIFNISNKQGLNYWLEFKNDKVMSTYTYGSIAGGSSFKYIMFKRSIDGVWVTGNPQNPTELTVEEAIDFGRQLRNALCAGAKIIESLPDNIAEIDYDQLQRDLERHLTHNMDHLGWVHKYYHMIYPDKIDAFHTTKWQRHCLIASGIKPKSESLYLLAGQLMPLVKKTGLPTAMVMGAMVEHFGQPLKYYRIGTGDEHHDQWPDMRINSHIGLGWSYLGDLKERLKDKDLKDFIATRMQDMQTYNNSVASKKANEVIRFVNHIEEGDIVLAAKGETIYGIGQVSSFYKYKDQYYYAHTRDVEWLKIYREGVKLPVAKEGLRQVCSKIKDIDNIMFIEKEIAEKSEEVHIEHTRPLTPLTGTMADIEMVLRRKKQIIIYGPPGTGKTYHAEKVCMELASRSVFKKSSDILTEVERHKLLGDGITHGNVRMCCFHPTYGYEDFIEGIKPKVMNQQTVFEMQNGIFKNICDAARKNKNENFYLLIDEINRGDISRIFGELIMLIENAKRGKSLLLPLSGESFSVPENLYIVGTMNTADRSIALLDVALRRRFGFLELMPNYDLLSGVNIEGLPFGKWLRALNERICENLGKDARNLQIGHSYFMDKGRPIEEKEDFKSIVKEDIVPLLEEYCYGDYGLLSTLLGDGLVNQKRQTINTSIFEGSDISELVNALLIHNPELRIESNDDSDDTDSDEDGDLDEPNN